MTGINKRTYFLDYLKGIIIVLVVMLHTAVTYSGVGNWHYIDAEKTGMVTKLLSALFVAFTNSYFMGLMFLIAGYFSAKSLASKTRKKYVIGRVERLGLPWLVFTLGIYPLTLFILYMAKEKQIMHESFFSFYLEYVKTFEFLNGSGPLWFVLALLIFSIIYALVGNKKNVKASTLPSFSITTVVIVLAGVVSFIIRTKFHFNDEFLNIPMSFIWMHSVMYFIGIKAYQGDWFNQISYHYSKKWLIATIILGIVIWICIIMFGGVLKHGQGILDGNMNWQSIIYAIWESFVCIGMSIGMIGFFKEKFNKRNVLLTGLSKNSFAVYVWHTPVLICISLLFRNSNMYAVLKILVVGGIALITSYLLSHYVFRRLPILKRIM
ncbi:MAG: acyltransferase family protein [Clostridia bacterium]|nr:acyltransferase family protein [Clostridia bacterium]